MTQNQFKVSGVVATVGSGAGAGVLVLRGRRAGLVVPSAVFFSARVPAGFDAFGKRVPVLFVAPRRGAVLAALALPVVVLAVLALVVLALVPARVFATPFLGDAARVAFAVPRVLVVALAVRPPARDAGALPAVVRVADFFGAARVAARGLAALRAAGFFVAAVVRAVVLRAAGFLAALAAFFGAALRVVVAFAGAFLAAAALRVGAPCAAVPRAAVERVLARRVDARIAIGCARVGVVSSVTN